MTSPSPAISRLPPRVGILMEPSRNYERGILSGIARYMELHGPWQTYRRLPAVSGGEGLDANELANWHPEGLIAREEADIRPLLPAQVPLVYAPSTRPARGCSNILAQDFKIGEMAANHLLDCGLEHFAFCGMDARYFWSRRRRDGFSKLLQASGFRPHVYHRPRAGSTIRWEEDLADLKQWIKILPAPLGLMVCTDDLSLLVTEACSAIGRRIPEDIAMIGVGNDEAICGLAPVPLSSIRLNLEQGGYAAAAHLDAHMQDAATQIRDIYIEPVEVVARRSTDVLAIDDPLVARAVAFIRDQSKRPLHVEQVVASIPLSRRALYTRFRRATGMGIYAYIRRARLDTLARLLRETSLPVAEIADLMGYPDEKNVARSFRQVQGMTPRVYRRNHAAETCRKVNPEQAR